MLKSLSVALVLCSLIVAQDKSASHTWGSHVGPEAPDAAFFDLDWNQQATLAAAHIPTPSYFLVRPDGHVGLSGGRIDPATLDRYAAERLRIGASTR